MDGAPGTIRTCDTRIRNPVLYPLSYGGDVQGMRELTYGRGTCQEASEPGSAILDWSLVLSARGIYHEVVPGPEGAKILVPAYLLDDAREEIRLYEEENRPSSGDSLAEAPLHGPRGHEATLWAVAVLTAVLGLALKDEWMPWLISAGGGDALKIQQGQWWRAVTSLTLHSDPAHLLGNMFLGGLIILWLGDILGTGPAWLLAISSGVLGNLVNAYLKDQPWVSVGASTAVFGAIGVLTACHAVLRSGWRAVLVSMGAGLALLGMLGSGGARTDLGAHFFGFAWGVILGVPAALARRRVGEPPGWVQFLLVTALLSLVVCAWGMAIRGPWPPSDAPGVPGR